jgi:uncharacterized protein (DUF305 family)
VRKIRKRRIGAMVIVALLSALFYAGGPTLKAAGSGTSGDEPDCGRRLRQAMDDMHHQMHAVVSSGDADEDFIRLMLPHHQAAVEMAKVEMLCGKDAAGRRLAQEIIADQQSEIDLMHLWLSRRATPGAPRTPESEVMRP